jgi:hypothetical protein
MSSVSPIVSAIHQLQEQFWQALQIRDARAFEVILAPHFVGRSPGEADQTRAEFIATLLRFPGRVTVIGGEDLAVHVWDTVAVLTGVQVARLHLSNGTQLSSRVLLSNVFCQEPQGWQMVLSYAVELRQNL